MPDLSDLYVQQTTWRATAPVPEGPWQVDLEPTISPGHEGEWDGRRVGDASVVQTDEGYVMYYTGSAPLPAGAFSEEKAMLGLARSTDGKVWKRYDNPSTGDAPFKQSDPVFKANTADGAWDNWNVMDADVQPAGDGWTMVYRSGTS